MIKNILMGFSFTLRNLIAYSHGLINVRLRLVSNLSMSEKEIPDDLLSPTASISSNLIHSRFMIELRNIVNQPKVDPELYVKFLRKIYFYETHEGYLKKLQRNSHFKLFCENLSDTSVTIPRRKVAFILIQLSKLGITSMNPLMVMRYWARHIDRSKFIDCVEIENLIVEVLGRSENAAWIQKRKFSLERQLKRKFLNETLEQYSTPSIVSAFNLMKVFGFVDLRASEILLKTLANQLPPNWLQIFLILTSFDSLLPEHELLLQQAKKHVFEDIFVTASLHSLPNLISLLESISTKVYHGHLEFYDPKVVDAIVDKALRNECCCEEGNVILSHISSIYHQHIPFLDYLIKKYEDDYHDKKLIQLVNLFSYAVRINCEKTARILLEKLICQKKSIGTSHKMLTNVTYYMSVLDYCDQGLLETFFTSGSLVRDIHNYKIQGLISWKKIFRPSFPLPKLVDMEFENIKEKNVKIRQLDNFSQTTSKEFDKENVFPLKSKLESIFGGPEYLLTNVEVRFRIVVDHAVIFRQGGFPVAVNSNTKTSDNDDISLNTISIPPNSHIILFNCIPSRGYILNTGEMNGPYKSYIKCLKELKYNTILVNQFEWSKVPDSERIPWLMRIIREECGHIFENEAYSI